MDNSNSETIESAANTSNDSNDQGESQPKRRRGEVKRQQFTTKQRIDIYAFCVLEHEMRGDSVSIKKRLLAIKRALEVERSKKTPSLTNRQADPQKGLNTHDVKESLEDQEEFSTIQPPSGSAGSEVTYQNSVISRTSDNRLQDDSTSTSELCDGKHPSAANDDALHNGEGEALLKLQKEILDSGRGYSEYQKTLFLTAGMLRNIQLRFSKYYPKAPVPSKSTIKHVFEKCVEHGCVENIKNPRKKVKIPQGDEVEYLVLHEPQLSMRQMAQKLNVSVGTISRRCKALGLMPESVALKHQQMAVARRQKQAKELKKSKV